MKAVVFLMLGGKDAAVKLSNLREILDQKIKRDSRSSSIADQEANLYGRQQAERGGNRDKYRPKNLPSKY